MHVCIGWAISVSILPHCHSSTQHLVNSLISPANSPFHQVKNSASHQTVKPTTFIATAKDPLLGAVMQDEICILYRKNKYFLKKDITKDYDKFVHQLSVCICMCVLVVLYLYLYLFIRTACAVPLWIDNKKMINWEMNYDTKLGFHLIHSKMVLLRAGSISFCWIQIQNVLSLLQVPVVSGDFVSSFYLFIFYFFILTGFPNFHQFKCLEKRNWIVLDTNSWKYSSLSLSLWFFCVFVLLEWGWIF